MTRKNVRSHLGDGTGQPRGRGGKAIRAARNQLLTIFGKLPIEQIGPQDVRAWQAALLRDHYERSSILSCRTCGHPRRVEPGGSRCGAR